MDININVNIDSGGNATIKEDGLKIKKKTRKLKNGKEVILEMPDASQDTAPQKNVLTMMGL